MHLQPSGSHGCFRGIGRRHGPDFSALAWFTPDQPANHSHFTVDQSLHETHTRIQVRQEDGNTLVGTFCTFGGFSSLCHTWSPSFCTTGPTTLPLSLAGRSLSLRCCIFLCGLFVFAPITFTSCHEIFITTFAFAQFLRAAAGVPSAGGTHGVRIKNSHV